jgi:hypothetical protein
VGIQNGVIGLMIVELLDRGELLPFLGYYALSSLAMVFVWVRLLSRPTEA